MDDSEDSISFYVNGKEIKVDNKLSPYTRLVDFLRDNLHLKGTKITCREGGCGACVVSANIYDQVSKAEKTISINSCLIPLYSCSGLSITTIDGIGNRHKGYHQVQQRLADYNGTQCGYCSPGMVMTMYSLLENNSLPSVQEVEDLFDGNICRCTGYRPILDAMKSFALDTSTCPATNDIEDVVDRSRCPKTGLQCQCKALQNRYRNQKPIRLKFSDATWIRPMTLHDLFAILRDLGKARVRFVVGNTGTGVYKNDGPYPFYVDMKGLLELYQYSIGDPCTIGSNISLNSLIQLLGQQENQGEEYNYCRALYTHIKKIANVSVRNIGSWAGNLMMKKEHPEFPSDLFVLLEAIHAQIFLGHFDGSKEAVSPSKLLSVPMEGKIILNMILPRLTKNHHIRSYKVMPRSQNSHAYVNACFMAEVDTSHNYRVLSQPSLVFGGINPTFIHASRTEQFLLGKELGRASTLKKALGLLNQEIAPDNDPSLASPEYRKKLAVSLFYKFVLSVIPDKVNPRYRSGADDISRPVSSGTQNYETFEADWPLNQPIPKLEAKAQCSGEAEYIADIVRPPGTLYAAFVITTESNAVIKNIDPSEALKMEGVVKFLTDKDIPGQNNIVPVSRKGVYKSPEELFCSGKVLYAGQPVGLIVATSQQIADTAARKVKIEYTNLQPPILTIEEALKRGTVFEMPELYIRDGNPEETLKDSPNQLSGEVKVGTQFHFSMETQVCLSIPIEDGLDVYTSTQWLDGSQISIAQVLDVKCNSINLQVRRLGGGFGAKISRNFQTGTACSLAAHILNKPVCLQTDLETSLKSIGKRNPFLAKYDVGFEDTGKLNSVKMKMYMDAGCYPNEMCIGIAVRWAKNVYECANWSIESTTVLTNLPSNTYCRTPGSVKGIFVIETIMEHIAKHLNKDPLEVKEINLVVDPPPIIPNQSSASIRSIFSQLRNSADIEQRRKDIEAFNKDNRWKKRGLAVVPMKYLLNFGSSKFNVMISIYNEGGSVSILHGGVEMGQGINTKVAQVCAHELGIPLELVSVKPNNTFVNPNASWTAASTTSELNCKAVVECCKVLLKRIEPIRDQMDNPSWEELIQACYRSNVDLSARFMAGPQNKPESYIIYGATSAEAEIDVLTGSTQISRVDMLFDCGVSMSPEVDIGQIEGSFVMGMGLFLTEEVRYKDNGENLSASTWDYYLPTTKDIPTDFKITLLKNVPNPYGVLKSKSTGEPPLCMSSVVLFAVKNAIDAAREELGQKDWIPLSAPATPERIQQACATKKENLVINEEQDYDSE